MELCFTKLTGIDKGVREVLALNVIEDIVAETVLVATETAGVNKRSSLIRTFSDVLHENFPTLPWNSTIIQTFNLDSLIFLLY